MLGCPALVSVKVEGFRGLPDVSLDLGDLTIVVGPPGSGKTSFLEALFIHGLAAYQSLSTRTLLGSIYGTIAYRLRPFIRGYRCTDVAVGGEARVTVSGSVATVSCDIDKCVKGECCGKGGAGNGPMDASRLWCLSMDLSLEAPALYSVVPFIPMYNYIEYLSAAMTAVIVSNLSVLRTIRRYINLAGFDIADAGSIPPKADVGGDLIPVGVAGSFDPFFFAAAYLAMAGEGEHELITGIRARVVDMLAMANPEVGVHPQLHDALARAIADASTRVPVVVETHSPILAGSLYDHSKPDRVRVYYFARQPGAGKAAIYEVDVDRLASTGLYPQDLVEQPYQVIADQAGGALRRVA